MEPGAQMAGKGAVLRPFLRKMKMVGFCRGFIFTYRPFWQNGSVKRFARSPCGSRGSRTFYAKRFSQAANNFDLPHWVFFYAKTLGGGRKTIWALSTQGGTQ